MQWSNRWRTLERAIASLLYRWRHSSSRARLLTTHRHLRGSRLAWYADPFLAPERWRPSWPGPAGPKLRPHPLPVPSWSSDTIPTCRYVPARTNKISNESCSVNRIISCGGTRCVPWLRCAVGLLPSALCAPRDLLAYLCGFGYWLLFRLAAGRLLRLICFAATISMFVGADGVFLFSFALE